MVPQSRATRSAGAWRKKGAFSPPSSGTSRGGSVASRPSARRAMYARAMQELSVQTSFKVPLTEVSGLALQRVAGREARLLAVGDEAFELASAELRDATPGELTRHDLRPLLERVGRKGGSQWEGVACDSVGRVLVLQESPGAVFVFDAQLGELLATVTLDAGESQAGLAWGADSRSRGEGLAVLESGHLLIVKEKNPPQLIEFGRAGDAPGAIKPGGEARFDGGATLVALACWGLDAEGDGGPSDLSELAVGPDGAIYLLSDQERCIVRIAELSPGGGTVRIAGRWQLPRKLDKPEGLVILSDFRPLVAVDDREGKKSLFLLDALR